MPPLFTDDLGNVRIWKARVCFHDIGMLVLTVQNKSSDHISTTMKNRMSYRTTHHFEVLESWDQARINSTQMSLQ